MSNLNSSEPERWRHRFTGTALMTSEDGIKDNERYTLKYRVTAS